MTSDPQREANRCNAQRSTGPQTVEGKQRSQLNAVKHGAFLSHNDHISATILQESPEEIDELYEAIVDDLDPQTALEATQAQAIAQQIINQQRINQLTVHLASAEEVFSEEATAAYDYDEEEEVWRQVIHTISFREAPPEPEIRYDEIAKGLHRRLKRLQSLTPPSIDDTLTGDDAVEAWRDEVCRLASIVYQDHSDAIAHTHALRQHYARAANRQRRQTAGVEARRLLGIFDDATNLQDRVARIISRQLKSYRELQASRATQDHRKQNPRNEPNPNM